MVTFLDLLILVSMGLIAAGMLSLVLMFLVRNKKVQKVCFWIAAALGVYIGSVGIRINWPGFYGQAVLAGALMLVSVAALVLERLRKDDEKMFLHARIAAAASLVIGIVNALFI